MRSNKQLSLNKQLGSDSDRTDRRFPHFGRFAAHRDQLCRKTVHKTNITLENKIEGARTRVPMVTLNLVTFFQRPFFEFTT